MLGWIAFGLAAATAGAGLTWFTANARAARRASKTADANRADHANHPDRADHVSKTSRANHTDHANQTDHQNHTDHHNHASHPELFAGRLVVLHGAAAAVTVMLAALAALAIVT
jgi:Flp pilus assembly protein TadB